MINFREGLFEILPRGSFEMNDEYLKYKSKELEIRALSEQDQFEKLIEIKKNEEVLFGQEVVFRHFDSKQYLTGSSDCNEYSADAF